MFTISGWGMQTANSAAEHQSTPTLFVSNVAIPKQVSYKAAMMILYEGINRPTVFVDHGNTDISVRSVCFFLALTMRSAYNGNPSSLKYMANYVFFTLCPNQLYRCSCKASLITTCIIWSIRVSAKRAITQN